MRSIARHVDWLLTFSTLLALSACGPVSRHADAGAPPTEIDAHVPLARTDSLDLLFMIDDSGSMAQEQELIGAQISRVVRSLAGGDVDGDGSDDPERAFRSIHVGVITSDMGTASYVISSCGNGTTGYAFGDDGLFRSTSDSGCLGMESSRGVFSFGAEGDDDETSFATTVSCLTSAGTRGCGFEQQLEAVLKALSPGAPNASTASGYEPPMFLNTTRGHGDGVNAGFLRPDSVLAIVLLTDEEDCSIANPAVFDPEVAAYADTVASLRCFYFAETSDPALRIAFPIERYVGGESSRAGLLGLRKDPRRLVFAGIVGIPDGVTDEAVDFDAVLAHPDMQERVDPSGESSGLIPSCIASAGRGVAYPPRRIVRVAQGLAAAGAHARVDSICADDFGAASERILRAIDSAAGHD